jgi:DNA-binding FrmR family transcriptional regulator
MRINGEGISFKHREEIQQRLRCIEGHIRGITRMVMEDRSYKSILGQIQAVNGSLDKVAVTLIKELLLEGLSNNRSSEVTEYREQLLQDISDLINGMRLR